MATYTNIQASQLIATGTGIVSAIIVGSHSSGTIKLWDSQTANFNVIVPTYTYATGSQVITLNGDDGIAFNTGLFATLTNAQDITIVWQKT